MGVVNDLQSSTIASKIVALFCRFAERFMIACLSEAAPIKCAGRESASLQAFFHSRQTKIWCSLYRGRK